MSMSEEKEVVKQSQRTLQQVLLSDECSVSFKMDDFAHSMNSNTYVHVATVKIPAEVELRSISSKVNKVVEEYKLFSSLSRQGDNEGFVFNIYIRRPEKTDVLTFQDVVEDIRGMLKEFPLLNNVMEKISKARNTTKKSVK